MFTVLVAVAIAYRRRPEFHKRLMLLAMIAIIWPAFFRFRHYFPSVAYPEVVFGLVLPDSMILLAMVWEKFTIGRVNAIYLTAGLALIAENIAELFLFDTCGWRVLGNWLASLFL